MAKYFSSRPLNKKTINYIELAKLHQKPPVKTPPLSWEKLIEISCSSLTLRHVNSIEIAKKEMREGTWRERYVVSLSRGVYGIITQMFEERASAKRPLDLSDDKVRKTTKESVRFLTCQSKEDEKTIVKMYKMALYTYIAEAFFIHNRQFTAERDKFEEETIDNPEEWINRRKFTLCQSATFLIIYFLTHEPYDYENNQYLGKAFKSFEPKDYKKCISVPTKTLLEYTPDPSLSFTEQVAQIDAVAIQSIFEQVLTYLKKYKPPLNEKTYYYQVD